MTSLGTLCRLTASTLLVATAACADDITQVAGQPQPAASPSETATNVSGTAAKPPTLVAVAISGTSSQLANGPLPPPSRPGLFYRVEVNGAGFPAGESMQSRTIAVTLDGSKLSPSSAGGVIPADGTYRAIHSASCPSQYREMYEVVTVGGRTTESNHVTLGC
jgi:hypothetical protein